MALILQIETATQSCSVAISLNGEVLGIVEKTDRNIHASSITLFIEELMQKCAKSFQDLDAVAVSMGPGSYTGLRIGVSTAKGLCYALDIPLIAINTLTAMASGFKQKCFSVRPGTLFCPMIDARRMEVYCAIYDSEIRLIDDTEAKIIDEDSFSNLLANHIIYFFGDGAGKCVEVLEKHQFARVIQDFSNSARYFSLLAYEKFMKADFVDVAYFEPFYLKDFVSGNKK